MANDDLVDVVGLNEADADRQEDAKPLDRGVEFLVGVGVHVLADLIRVGSDAARFDQQGPTEGSASVVEP